MNYDPPQGGTLTFVKAPPVRQERVHLTEHLLLLEK